MNNDEKLLTITTEDGTEVLCEILFTHYSEEFKKNYVVFCEKGTNQASAAIFFPSESGDGNGSLEQIKTEEEWEMLEDLLESYVDEATEDGEGCGHSCEDCGHECDGDCDGDDDCECGCHHHHE